MHTQFRSVWRGNGTYILLWAVFLAFPGVSRAQSGTGLLQIQIGPSGAAVELKGPENTLTASPNSISRPIPGWYRLKASYPGFENFTRDVYIDTQSPATISGTLSPKSRWKAGARSVFIPGWGHDYSERTARGVAFTVLTAGMLVGYVLFNDDAGDQLKQYEQVREEYDAAESVAEQEALLPSVEQALEDAYDADSERLTWGYITLGVYLYQIVDAVVFFPTVPEVQFGKMQLGLTMPNAQTVALGASYEF